MGMERVGDRMRWDTHSAQQDWNSSNHRPCKEQHNHNIRTRRIGAEDMFDLRQFTIAQGLRTCCSGGIGVGGDGEWEGESVISA